MAEGDARRWNAASSTCFLNLPRTRRTFAEIAARTPHFVLSRTLGTVEWPSATVLAGGVEGIANLKRQGGRDILMWGGPTVTTAAIDAELIDEYHLVTNPVIAGAARNSLPA